MRGIVVQNSKRQEWVNIGYRCSPGRALPIPDFELENGEVIPVDIVGMHPVGAVATGAIVSINTAIGLECAVIRVARPVIRPVAGKFGIFAVMLLCITIGGQRTNDESESQHRSKNNSPQGHMLLRVKITGEHSRADTNQGPINYLANRKGCDSFV